MSGLLMTENERQISEELLSNGMVTIDHDNVSILLNALIKATPKVAEKMVSIIDKDTNLKQKIVEEISKTSDLAIISANAISIEAFENAKRTNEYVMSLLNNKELSDEKFCKCIEFLHFNAELMERKESEHLEFMARETEKQQKALESESKRALFRTMLWSFVGGVTAGVAGGIAYNAYQKHRNIRTRQRREILYIDEDKRIK